MTIASKVGSFNIGTGTADIVVSGLGFQPKAIIFFWTGATSSTDAVGAVSNDSGWGFATSTTDRRGVGTHATLGAGNSAGSIYHSDVACIIIASESATVAGLIDMKSIDSDGFTLAVDDASPVDLRVMYIALGGADITNVKTGQYLSSLSTGNVDVTDVGFQGNIVFAITPLHLTTAPPSGGGAAIGVGFGAAISSSKQYVVMFGDDDGSATMDTAAYIYNGEFAAGANPTTPTSIKNRQAFVAWLSNGFRFNQLEIADSGQGYGHYLVIKGGSWDLGDLLTQTDTTTTVTESGLAFQPKMVLFASANRALSTQDTGTVHGQISFGAATSTSARMAMAFMDENGTANAETSAAVEYDEVYANVSASDAIQGLMDITAINSDGFSVIMDDADPAQAYVWWVAAGDAAASNVVIACNAGALNASEHGAVIVPGAVSIACAVGALNEAAPAATISNVTIILCSVGALALSEHGAAILPGVVNVACGVGVLNLSEHGAAILPGGVNVACSVSILTLAGWQVDAVPGAVSVVCGAGALNLNEHGAAILPGAVNVACSIDTFALNGWSATISSPPPGISVLCSVGALALSEYGAAILPGGVSVTCGAGALNLNEHGVTILPGGVNVACFVGVLTLAGWQADAVPGGVSVVCGAGALNLNEHGAAILPGGVNVACSSEALALNGWNVTISTLAGGINVQCVVGALSLYEPGAALLPGDVSIACAVEDLSFGAHGLNALPGAVNVACSVESLTLAGWQADAIPGDVIIGCDLGAMVLTGWDALIISGEIHYGALVRGQKADQVSGVRGDQVVGVKTRNLR